MRPFSRTKFLGTLHSLSYWTLYKVCSEMWYDPLHDRPQVWGHTIKRTLKKTVTSTGHYNGSLNLLNNTSFSSRSDSRRPVRGFFVVHLPVNLNDFDRLAQSSPTFQSFTRYMIGFLSSMRSLLTRCSWSTTIITAAKVINTEASTVEAAIMNMMIICSLAAWWTEDPPRMAPVIIPGIEMIPMTL